MCCCAAILLHLPLPLPKAHSININIMPKAKPKPKQGDKRQYRRAFSFVRRPYRIYSAAPWKWITVLRAVDDRLRSKTGTITSVAKAFGIERSTLGKRYNAWLKGGRQVNGPGTGDRRVGGHRAFTADDEHALAHHLVTAYVDRGLPLVDADVLRLARQRWSNGQGSARFLAGRGRQFLGSHWWVTRFKRQHGFCSRRPSVCRVATNVPSQQELDKFRADCRAALVRYGSARVWNADETSWKLVPKGLTTWSKSGTDGLSFHSCSFFFPTAVVFTDAKSVKLLTKNTEKDCVTVLVCVGAAGDKAPSLVIKKGTTPRCCNKLRTRGCIIGYSKKGWINATLFKLYLTELSRFLNNEPFCIIVDQYKAHDTPAVQAHATSLNIQILLVPAGTTAVNQPLDVAVNGPLKSSTSVLACPLAEGSHQEADRAGRYR